MAERSGSIQYPYKPSWQNQFYDWIETLPVPVHAVILFVFLFFFFINHLFPWIEGKLPWGYIDFYQLNFLIWFFVAFYAFFLFRNYSRTAIEKFRPAMDITDREFAAIRAEFVNLSSRAGWIITILAVPIAIFSFSSTASQYMQAGLSQAIFIITETFTGAFVFGFFFNIFRQYRLISRLYSRVKNVNIFHLSPLYAFSGFTYRTGLFLIITGILSYLTNVTFSETVPQFGSFLFFSALNLIIAIGAFLLPLGGIHAKLEIEKQRISKENDVRIDRALHQLHQKIDKKKLTDMVAFRNSISALMEFRQEINRISTWPWEPGTLRNFVTALFIPLTVWAIQQVLTRVVVR